MAIQPGNLPLTLQRGIEFQELILQCKDADVTVSGTLSPDVTGTFVLTGTFATYPLFVLPGAPATFLYFNAAAASYVIARLLTTAALTDYWSPAAPLLEPTGTYAPHGANTGTATATDHPADLTGYFAQAQVRRTPLSGMFLDLEPEITDDVNGEVTIPAITSAATAALTSYGTFYWDLVFSTAADFSTGRVGPFVAGTFLISDNITHPSDAPPEL